MVADTSSYRSSSSNTRIEIKSKLVSIIRDILPYRSSSSNTRIEIQLLYNQGEFSKYLQK